VWIGVPGTDSDYEARLDEVLEDGTACEDTGSEISKISSSGDAQPQPQPQSTTAPAAAAVDQAPKATVEDDSDVAGPAPADNPDEGHATDTDRIVEKLGLLSEIGEELEELLWRRKELVFDLDDYALNEEQAEIEHNIRVIEAKPSRLVTPDESKRHEDLMAKLLAVVKRRDALVEQMEAERSARRAIVLENSNGNVVYRSNGHLAASGGGEEPGKKDKAHKKLKIPKLKSKTLKKIKDKMHVHNLHLHHHHHHGAKDAEKDEKKRSSKKS
jgi:hypothetical protein